VKAQNADNVAARNQQRAAEAALKRKAKEDAITAREAAEQLPSKAHVANRNPRNSPRKKVQF
jgi:hypothetical protein